MMNYKIKKLYLFMLNGKVPYLMKDLFEQSEQLDVF